MPCWPWCWCTRRGRRTGRSRRGRSCGSHTCCSRNRLCTRTPWTASSAPAGCSLTGAGPSLEAPPRRHHLQSSTACCLSRQRRRSLRSCYDDVRHSMNGTHARLAVFLGRDGFAADVITWPPAAACVAAKRASVHSVSSSPPASEPPERHACPGRTAATACGRPGQAHQMVQPQPPPWPPPSAAPPPDPP